MRGVLLEYYCWRIGVGNGISGRIVCSATSCMLTLYWDSEGIFGGCSSCALGVFLE
jgi:hypothetical protein